MKIAPSDWPATLRDAVGGGGSMTMLDFFNSHTHVLCDAGAK